MSSFNDYIKNSGAKTIVNRYFSDLDVYSDTKIISLSHKILEEPSQPGSYYTENGLTATFKVQVEYITSNEPKEVKFTTFEIPKEVDGSFYIDGAPRIAFNKLNGDPECRIYMGGRLGYVIKFDYNREYDIKKKILSIKRPSPERTLNINLDKIDSTTEDYKEAYLKLSDYQKKKLAIKLDLDYVPEYITSKLIQECIAYGDDRMRDLIIDKKIDSAQSGLIQYLTNFKTMNLTRRHLMENFRKLSRLPEEVNAITNLAIKFFKGSQDITTKDSGVQVPMTINAINQESTRNKIQIPETVAFNTTMADLIDLADTPINQNTNIQNSLTVSTHITDEAVLFDVFNKEFQRITIEYIDYLNSKVCASEYVDYEKKQMKPDEKGEVEVKYRMYRKKVKVGEVDFIDLHPDYRLSATTRRIPFLNSTDSVRISMGTTMLKQSIPLANAERSLVDTGHYEELNDNVFNEKFAYDEGKVIKIDEDNVTIQLKDKTEVQMKRKTALKSQYDICTYFEPKVKVGQKVKKGDVITGAVNLEKDTYKAGINALVLFHAMFGYVNEDALVVSRSFAEKAMHYSIIDLQIDVKTNNSLKWIAPIGTKVRSGDEVVKLFNAVRLDEVNKALAEKLGGLFGEEGTDLTQYTIEKGLKVPNNIEEAWVSDILVQENKKPAPPKSVKAPDYTFARESQKVIDEYDKTKDRKVIYDKFPEYIAADTLDPIIMDPGEYKIVYSVRVRLIKKTILMIGSKVTNRYGGKGVVSKVLPDEEMPIMVDKSTGKQTRVDVVMNPYSTINRKIAGVLYEQNLGLIAHKVYDLVEQYKTTKTNQKKIMPLVNKFYPGRYEDMSVEDFINLHETRPIEEVYYFNVGCFSKIKPEQIEEWMDDLELESQSDILMPSDSVADLDELRENLSEEEYEKIVKGMKGKYTKVDKKLQCGYLTLEVLYHIPSYKGRVTNSLVGKSINYKKDEPVMGKGLYRETGQKIDELSLFSLLSRNVRGFIESSRSASVKEENQIFLNNLLGLGLTISDSKGYNQGGSYAKNEINSMKARFRLKTNQNK